MQSDISMIYIDVIIEYRSRVNNVSVWFEYERVNEMK